MNAQRYYLGEFFNKTAEYKLPIYQRHYEWTQTNWAHFWNTIYHNYLPNTQKPLKFFGTFILLPDEDESDLVKKVYEVIDGQQRLTTISLLLAAIRDCSGLKFEKDEINTLILKKSSDYQKNVENGRILLSYKDNGCYNRIINNCDSASSDDSIGIFNCYQYFCKILKELPEPLNWEKFSDTLFGGLESVAILLGPSDLPGPIFETVNAYAKPLDPIDNIRTFIFSWTIHTNVKRFYKKYWIDVERGFQGDNQKFLDFISTILSSCGENIPEDGEYQNLTEKLRSPDPIMQDKNIENFLQKVKIYDVFYKYLEKPDSIPINKYDQKIKYGLKKLSLCAPKSHYPFLLNCLEILESDIQAEIINKNDFLWIISMIESLYIRRYVCGESNQEVSDAFINLSKDIILNKNIRVKDLFIKHLNKYYPKDDAFIADLERIPLYKEDTAKKNYARLILISLEEYLGLKSPGCYAFHTESHFIEHIMPQTLNDIWLKDLGEEWEDYKLWLHTLGNLTLTSQKANPMASNSSFQDKKKIYQKCLYRLNERVLQPDHWDFHSISKRGEFLSKTASEIWKIPKDIIDPPIIKIRNVKPNESPCYLKIKGEKIPTTTWEKVQYYTIERMNRCDPLKFNQIIEECPKDLSKKEGTISKGIFIEDSGIYYRKIKKGKDIHIFCKILKDKMEWGGDDWYGYAKDKENDSFKFT
jgi:uncharacterized protein with ParB-like and HNH nuclease domain